MNQARIDCVVQRFPSCLCPYNDIRQPGMGMAEMGEVVDAVMAGYPAVAAGDVGKLIGYVDTEITAPWREEGAGDDAAFLCREIEIITGVCPDAQGSRPSPPRLAAMLEGSDFIRFQL